MESFRRIFFQILLFILVVVFVLSVRYVYENESVGAGSFEKYENGNVTISQMLSELVGEDER